MSAILDFRQPFWFSFWKPFWRFGSWDGLFEDFARFQRRGEAFFDMAMSFMHGRELIFGRNDMDLDNFLLKNFQMKNVLF